MNNKSVVYGRKLWMFLFALIIGAGTLSVASFSLVIGVNAGFVTEAPEADPSGGLDYTIDGYAIAFMVTSPSTPAKIVEVGWWCDDATEAANWEMGIYSDNAGEPDTLLEVSRTNAKGTDAGWKSAVVDWDIEPETIYWIATQLDATDTGTETDFVNDAGEEQRTDFSSTTLETTFVTDSSLNRIPAFYAVWEEVVYTLNITDPTTTAPESVVGGDNITIAFNFTENEVDLTRGVTMENVTVGGEPATILSNYEVGYELFDDGFEDEVEWTYWTESGKGNWRLDASGDLCDGLLIDCIVGGFCACCDDCDAAQCWLNLTTPLDLTVCSEASLKWEQHIQSNWDLNIDYFWVDVMDSDSAWTNIYECNSDGCDKSAWDSLSYNIKDGIGLDTGFKVRFHANVGGAGEEMALDYIRVECDGDVQEFGYVFGEGWQVNVTVPTDSLSGLQDLFLNATYSGFTRGDTQTNAINYEAPPEIAPTISAESINATDIYENESVRANATVKDDVAVTDVKFLIHAPWGTINVSYTGSSGDHYWLDCNETSTVCKTNVTGSYNYTSVWATDGTNNNGTTVNLQWNVSAAPPVDTCSCPSGENWLVACSDDCVITEDCDINDYTLLVNGDSGTFTILADIRVDVFVHQEGCVIINVNGDGNSMIMKEG